MKLIYSLAMAVSCTGLSTLALASDQKIPAFDSPSPADIEREVQAIGGAFGASDDSALVDHHGRFRHGPCGSIKLEAEQKAALRSAMFAFKKARISLAADVKLAGINYVQTVLNTASTRDEASAAGTAVADAVGKIAASHTALGTTILYDVLTPEQRGPGVACLLWLKKHYHHGHCDNDHDDNNHDD